MQPFIDHRGIAAALRMDNVDTDVIITMDDLLSMPRARLGACAFRHLRYDVQGRERPDFILNRPAWRDASILLAGRNFGTGSSREGAVHAMAAMGLRAVIAPTFGDIFYSNCLKNGLLPIRLDEDAVATLMDAADAAAGQQPFAISLPDQVVTPPGGTPVAFDIGAQYKSRLLAGEDEIGLTLGQADLIRQWQQADRLSRPWAWPL